MLFTAIHRAEYPSSMVDATTFEKPFSEENSICPLESDRIMGFYCSSPIHLRKQAVGGELFVNMKRIWQWRCPAWLACSVWLAGALLPAASESPGRQIYSQQCASCHGPAGEGVKGKFDETLQGDWSVERLTRYIHKAMPDDDPDKCVDKDAELVARYIYDAFYSREARARKNPARVELVRLTNRQYVNTVADLIKHFTGSDAAVGEERGLRGTYFGTRHFNNKAFDRVDRRIEFDFGENFPEDVPAGTNGFSVQWRGSLIAEETGDYEFIIKTPNGARLWVNAEDEPCIDAWVASGEASEHKATVRLIGGRVYPLRLDVFRFKDKTASISLEWKPPHGVQELIPARNLTPARVSPTLVVTTPFPPDDSSVGYERGVMVSKAWNDATTHAAIEVANYVARHLDRLSRSKAADADRAAKVQAFCEEFAATAFRRPLTDEQKRAFVGAHFRNDTRLEDAVKRVVLLTLKSPRFLYLGLESGKPDNFDVAARLSFGLWDSLPDRALWKTASQGNLRNREQIIREARRMLNDPRARAKMQYFFHHWLQMSHVEDMTKDDQLFPGFSHELIADLRVSLNLFLEDVMWNGASDYRALLKSETLFVNERLAKFYGMKTDGTDEFVQVQVSGEPRSGVLTHPYLLSAFAYQKYTSPIHRGVFLTRNIVGRALRPPPVAVAFQDTEFAPNLTMREKVAELTRSDACQTCHSVINPLGFSLENYDAVGRFRTRENDREIDTVSDYVTDSGETIRLASARDVAAFALGDERAQSGFVEQLFHQVVKQPMLAYGSDTMNHLRQSFVASEFNMQKLLVEIAAVSALHGLEAPTSSRK